MVQGLYTAAMGMMTSQAQVDTISNNLANVNTPGYCGAEMLEMAFPQMLIDRLDNNGAAVIGQAGTGNTIAQTYTSFDESGEQKTGNPLDMAVQGNAFFTVRDAQGQTYYTRNGDFMLNQQSQLVTDTGDTVLGETNGQPEAIFVPGGNLTVSKDGSLSGAVNATGQAVGSLMLSSRPNNAAWTPAGNSLFSGQAQNPGSGYAVEQGYSEDSNVNAVSELVKMIEASRSYEANAKVITTTDQTLSSLVNSVGNVNT
jgi:flagellar basal-body rod protein FlgG